MHVKDRAACMQILRTFHGGAERVQAAVTLLPALPNPAGAPTLLAPLSHEQRAAVQGWLGDLAFFDAANATGRYSLDMSQLEHRVVLARLLHASVTAAPWRACPTRHNLRNIELNGRALAVRALRFSCTSAALLLLVCRSSSALALPRPCCPATHAQRLCFDRTLQCGNERTSTHQRSGCDRLVQTTAERPAVATGAQHKREPGCGCR
jgi:hypothetical protein